VHLSRQAAKQHWHPIPQLPLCRTRSGLFYKAFTTSDIKGAIYGMRALGFRGCSVSMPFKEDVIALVDEMDKTAAAIQSVNTIVNTGGILKAYNTDYGAVAELIAKHDLDNTALVVIQGSGGMAKACGAAFRDSGFTAGVVLARNESTGRALATELHFEWRSLSAATDSPSSSLLSGSWSGAIFVNVTPIGMRGTDELALAFPEAMIQSAKAIFDVVAFPSETPLIRMARKHGRPVITGAEVIALQAAKQFELYTGVQPTADQVLRASIYSRQ